LQFVCFTFCEIWLGETRAGQDFQGYRKKKFDLEI
jgi:hypothetical protein